jgi:predicted ATP-dependent serine protease
VGKCPGCGEWNSLVETVVSTRKEKGKRKKEKVKRKNAKDKDYTG